VVAEAMLKLAGVGPDDVVYDLGCGDGRIVATAVEKFQAKHGVGVDLDPERIQDSKSTARQHHVEDRVEFRQGDVMEIPDLGKATVVTLYLSDALNLQLRPLLRKNLQPGTRIVTHRFTMGDWKPLKSETIHDSRGIKYTIHLWKVGDGEAKKLQR
jgi:ribosomal protein L11 methylase PrmA